MRFDLADLQLFLCVVDAGSITQGAVRAHLALASASERLRSIENAAGVALLERQPRGVSTTEAGDALAHHARLILRQQALLRGELQDFANGALGTLRLYANTSALSEFLPNKLAPWLAERPRLQVELKERTSSEIVRTINAGLAEAGIVTDAVEPGDLSLQPVAKDHLALIVPATHHLRTHKSIQFDAVADQPFVGLAPGSAMQDHIDEQARRIGKTLNLRIRMKTFEGLCEMVAHGVGLGIIPLNIARRQQRRHGYHTLALNDDWARRQLCLCYRDWDELSAPMHSLLEHLGGVSPGKPSGQGIGTSS